MKYFRIIEIENVDVSSEIAKYKSTKLLISDGVRLGRNIMHYDIKIQRILTPYQLERIIIDGGIERYLILISSSVFDSWSLIVIDELSFIMEQAAYNGNMIIFEIVGYKTVNEAFIG